LGSVRPRQQPENSVQHTVRGPQRHDRSFHGGRDRPGGGMPGTLWLAGRSSGSPQGRAVPDERPEQGWILVWALGRELCVWHERRFAGAGDGVVDGAKLLCARRLLAAPCAESRWELWRIVAQL